MAFPLVENMDYPRMCGEQPYSMPLRYFLAGSPPRVRGTGILSRQYRKMARITPARAGNSQPAAVSMAVTEDHPRACGEQLRIAQTATNEQGSPPRVRGTDSVKSTSWSVPMDHPRACGEQDKIRILTQTA